MKTYEFEGGNSKLRIIQKGRSRPKLEVFDNGKWQEPMWHFQSSIWDQLCRVTDMMPKNPR
jgi:hypothetical protein